MITQIRGVLQTVGEETLTLAVEPWELEILIPEIVRRQLQTRVGEMIALHTMFYLEGGQMATKLVPRLVGFLSTIDREFFDVFCSVDGVGVRKALRAMAMPVRDIARTIQDQDVKTLATYPGIGEAMAERIVAKLRRKVGKYALIVGGLAAKASAADVNGIPENADPDVIRDTYAALISVGHSESHARQLIDRALTGKKKFRSAADMIDVIYRSQREDEGV